jgi:hypothetical protein
MTGGSLYALRVVLAYVDPRIAKGRFDFGELTAYRSIVQGFISTCRSLARVAPDRDAGGRPPLTAMNGRLMRIVALVGHEQRSLEMFFRRD